MKKLSCAEFSSKENLCADMIMCVLIICSESILILISG